VVHQLLDTSGYTVLSAVGGAEALEICEQHSGPIDLLLSDVVMPGVNGRELAARAVALRPEIEVLLMSGYIDEAVLRNGASGGDLPILPKPFKPGALATRVREALGGRSTQ
jgi:CheY-like chemotaxis protein